MVVRILHAKNQLDSSSCFDTILACDGRMDIQHNRKYHNSIVSRSDNKQILTHMSARAVR